MSRAGVALPDLVGREDVEVLVRAFYTRAFADDLLGPFFLDVAQMDLEAHLPVMCDFWQTVLFRAGLYKRNALGGPRRPARRASPAYRALHPMARPMEGHRR